MARIAPERNQRDVVGRGFAFPLDVTTGGRVKWSVPLTGATDEDRRKAVTAILRHLVLTIAGERVVRRGYGTGISALLFAGASGPAVSAILREAVLTIRRWEPRIEIVSAASEVLAEQGRVAFVLSWVLRETGDAGVATIPTGLTFKAQGVG